MLTLGDYTVGERIYEGSDIVIYRGHRNADGEPVVIKVPRSDIPAPRDLARLRHEHAILQGIDVPGVVKARALEKYEGGVALVLEALDGETLGELLRARRLDVKAALRIGAAIAGILDGVHRLGIIHKDIKPQNLLIQRDTGAVRLIDFGMATRLSQETQQAVSPDAIEGTLAYLSPEQTGRMNRPVDRRADLYSLGVTLYQMLTAALPFASADPVELVHSHIARTPAAPRDVDPRIPAAVSDLVMKLLAKAPEDRYQTALGLQMDLEECARQIEVTGTVGALELGRHETAAALRVPQRLYGREAEERALLAAFERASGGAAELALVSGYSGIGKSALVHEIKGAIARRGGRFVAGKFDQLSRSVPYGPVTHALRDLLRQLLGERAEQLSAWRERLQRALGGNGQVIAELLPELAVILGPQPPVPALGPVESQNRMNLAFSGFVHVFTSAERPLVLFLDDLQWADPASLKLLQTLLDDPARHHLLLIGAYRDAEVGAAHPLAVALDELRRAGVAVSEVKLGPLRVPDLVELLCGALDCGPERAAPLASIVSAKTGGNPFFVSQFLHALHAERRITFDAQAGAWTWDLRAIEEREVTANVVELVAGKIRLLSPATQHVLQLASCIGHEFNLRTLSTIHERPPVRTAAALWGALQEGLVVPIDADCRFLHSSPPAGGAAAEAGEGAAAEAGEGAAAEAGEGGLYRFLHDRVQQAAYSLIDGADRAATHLRIGRLMLAGASPAERDEVLFDVVSHLNLGAALVTDPGERMELAELNLAAGRKAKASNAYEAAAHHFRSSVALLPASAWEARHALCFALHCEQAECEYLCGRFEQAEGLFQLLLERARSNVDGASVYALELKLFQVAGKYDEGVTLALQALRRFGVAFPEEDEAVQAATAAEAEEIRRLLGDRRIAALLDAPVMTDPEHRAVMGILSNLLPCAYIGRPSVFPLLTLKAVTLSLRHGNAPESCFAYSAYGLMLVSVFGDIPAGYQFSEMSIQLNERFDDAALKGTLLHIHADHIHFWCKHISTGFPILERAFDACLAVGDLVYGSYLAFETVWQAVERGDALDDVLRLSTRFAAFARQHRNEPVYQTIRMEQQFALALKGLTGPELSLDDDRFRGEDALAQVTRASFGCGVAFYHILRLILLYTGGRHEEALAAAAAAREVLGAVMAMPIEATFHFYEALALLARGAAPDPEAALRDRARLDGHEEKLARWARHCPENFEHKHLLVRAERARVAGDHLEAEALYDQAIESARDNGFTQHEALANELAGRALLARGRRLIAPVYLRAAYAAYLRWGALAKSARLAQEHPQILSYGAPSPAERPRAGAAHASTMSASSGSRSMSGLIDVTTVVRLGQALAGEIELPALLDRLMRVVLSNAGAARGFLVLEREGALRVEAEISVTPDLVAVGASTPIEERGDLPASVIYYVARTREVVALGDAAADPRFAGDPCLAGRGVRSILCLPLMHQRRLVGALYLENDLVRDAFGAERVEFLELLCSQAATALENALLYGRVREASAALRRSNEQLEAEVAQRTHDLREVNARLTLELDERAGIERSRAALQEEVIRVQNDLLQELSTPLIPITDEIVVLPLIGAMDARRAQQVMATVLPGAQRSGARVVIIDITGMRGVDSHVAAALLRTAAALRLLGAQAMLTGVRPEVARTLVGLGIDLGELLTFGTLQRGIAHAARVVGGASLGAAGPGRSRRA